MFTLRRENRLKTSEDFRRVFGYGKKKHKDGITIIICKNSTTTPRIGFAISKKQVKKAVDRNLIKRLAKETFRLQKKELQGLDLIVLVNKTCQNVSNKQIILHFQELFIASVRHFGFSQSH